MVRQKVGLPLQMQGRLKVSTREKIVFEPWENQKLRSRKSSERNGVSGSLVEDSCCYSTVANG